MESIKERAQALDITVRIGKNGVSDGTINEISRQLKARELVKIKLLDNFINGKDKNDTIEEIRKATRSQLITKRGFIFVLYKKK